jgi:hypothetical protein
MSRDFAPFVLTNFRSPPKLGDSLRRASSGSCEHPTELKEAKNPNLSGSPNVTIQVPGSGPKGSGGTSLTLAFDDFDRQNQKYEQDRMRWLENQLSPSREGDGRGSAPAGSGPTLQIVSANANLTVSPTGAQTQGTDPIVWTLTVVGTTAYYA